MKDPFKSPGRLVGSSRQYKSANPLRGNWSSDAVSEADFLGCKAFEGTTKTENLKMAWVGIASPTPEISEKESTCEVSATGRL